MKIYFASDHAGFELKNALLAYVRDELGMQVKDCGAFEYDSDDDYPVFVKKAAEAVSEDPENRRGIVLGGSGQGEAIVANRHGGVRAVVYYGAAVRKQVDSDDNALDVIESSREHNNANVLSIGARYVAVDDATAAVKQWLMTEFSDDERHARRIKMIDDR